MSNRPETYGAVMQPLEIEALPEGMANLYRIDALFREWLDLHDKVSRAEKVSSWKEWSPEQSDAYRRGDLETFSRLRGYTETEIADFMRCLKLGQQLCEKYGDEDLHSWMYEQQKVVTTPALQQLNRQLQQLAQA